jgi:hypothetical protein
VPVAVTSAAAVEAQAGPWAETDEANRPVGPAPVLAVFRRLPLDPED